MQDLRLKISGAQLANIEIVPCSDGSVDIIVHKQEQAENKPYKKQFNSKEPEDVVEEMKAAAREEYKKEDCDKKELQKFVEFWEKKITEDGWKGGSFNFQTLYNRWLDKAFKG